MIDDLSVADRLGPKPACPARKRGVGDVPPPGRWDSDFDHTAEVQSMDVPRRLALFGLEHLPLHMANRLSVCSNNRSKPSGFPPPFVRRIPASGAFQFWRFGS